MAFFNSTEKNPVIRLFSLMRSKTAVQTFMLFSSIILGIPLGIISTTITTRVLGADNYGVLVFFTTITTFSLLFFRFGFAASSGLIVAQTKENKQERELAGASILIFFLIGAAYSVFLFFISFFIDDIFDTSIGTILRLISFLLFYQPFQYIILSITRGANYIGVLSFYKISPRILYILTVLILLCFVEVDVSNIILVTVFSSLVVTVAVLIVLKPSFNNIRTSLRRIIEKNREYGINLYKAQIISMSSVKLSGLLISYFSNTTALGFYSLAMIMASPLVAFSQSLSTTLFKRFCYSSRIPGKAVGISFLFMFLGALFLWIMGKPIVVFLYTEEYLEVAVLLKFLVVSSIFEGLVHPFNAFLAAKGYAIWLKKIAFFVAVTYFVSNAILVPLWGAYGAAVASICGQFAGFAGHILYYRKYCLELTKE